MIRVRLLIGFVLVALLPVIGVGIGTYIVSYQNGRQQTMDRLESVAARKELALQVWVQSLQQELQVASRSDYAPKLVSNALALSNENASYSWYNNLVRKRLQFYVGQSAQFEEMFLIDLNGKVIVSTDAAREGKISEEFIQTDWDISLPYIQLPFYSADPADPKSGQDDASIFVLIPVVENSGNLVGAIGGKASVNSVHQLLSDGTGLGETGQAYLVDPSEALLVGTKLASGQSQSDEEIIIVQSEGVERSIEQRTNVEGLFTNPLNTEVIGIYRWQPNVNAVLVVEQNSSEAFQAVFMNTVINLVIAVIAVLVAVFSALFMTQNIANPIVDLAKTASNISRGSLETIADESRDDEVGALARAFNSMTSQLRDSINSLELRVKERTRDYQEANDALTHRALQLETSAQVGREITSILDIDVLLNRVVELIQGAFGYYHVQIFLLEQNTNQLIVGAGSGSENIQFRLIEMKRRSLNSEAALTGRMQLVEDVRQNPNFLFDDQLIETRSELVVPLRVGGRIIGTLDVHASQTNAFTKEDTLVIQSLGDQIAVAIENARLYDQSKDIAVLEERNRLARELHDSVTQSLYSLVLFTEGWKRMLKTDGVDKFEEYLSRTGEIAEQSLKEMRLLILELRPPALEQEGLVGALQKRLDAVEQRVGISARVVMEDFIEFPAPVEEELYRIAQEALNNSLKHAKATKVTVRIFKEEDKVVLEVNDDGVGFEPRSAEGQGGMGLSNMNERAKRAGGSLSIKSELGNGTTVQVFIPLELIYVPA